MQEILFYQYFLEHNCLGSKEEAEILGSFNPPYITKRIESEKINARHPCNNKTKDNKVFFFLFFLFTFLRKFLLFIFCFFFFIFIKNPENPIKNNLFCYYCGTKNTKSWEIGPDNTKS